MNAAGGSSWKLTLTITQHQTLETLYSFDKSIKQKQGKKLYIKRQKHKDKLFIVYLCVSVFYKS